MSLRIPEVSSLASIREFLESVRVSEPGDEKAGPRGDASVALRAARAFGWATGDDEAALTQAGEALLETTPGSGAERELFALGLVSSSLIRQVAGDVTGRDVSRKTLAQRIRRTTGASEGDADRQAGVLMQWRAEVEQRRLDFGAPEAVEEPDEAPEPAPPPANKTKGATPKPESGLDPLLKAWLSEQLEKARPCLFVGAGFSYGVKDSSGKDLPLGAGLAKEIWAECFPSDPFDDADSLPDVFEAALLRNRGALSRLLQRRLEVGSGSLPKYYRHLVGAPWQRIYTLNADNLLDVANVKFDLPRPIRPASALKIDGGFQELMSSGKFLPAIHLNGRADDGVDSVTFGARQYSTRLGDQDPAYSMLSADLLSRPFIFIGSPLVEPAMWMHLEMRGRAAKRVPELRPKSLLVTPSLSPARQRVLANYNVRWVPMTTEEFAAVIEDLAPQAKLGLDYLARTTEDSEQQQVERVSDLLANAKSRPTSFLLGAPPTWDDIAADRVIRRSNEGPLYEECLNAMTAARTARTLAKDATESPPAGIVLVQGTAGTGKSCVLMRLCRRLAADGLSVGFLEEGLNVAPRTIQRQVEQDSFNVLAIDDVARFGGSTLPLLNACLGSSFLELVIVGARSSQSGRVGVDGIKGIRSHTVPLLSNDDIGALLDLLTKEHRLGRLTGKSRVEQEKAFRDVCGRQLLVAMIEATSGRKFETRVFEEWEELNSISRVVYGVVAVATSFRGSLTREQVLIACPEDQAAANQSLAKLVSGQIIVQRRDRYRARHRVIAERLVDQLSDDANRLGDLFERLAFAVSANVHAGLPKSSASRRLLMTLLNSRILFNRLDLDQARSVYGRVENNLHWDHHFWLQRGSLEVRDGDVREAERYLDTALSLAPNDSFVLTEHAYMLLRKAVSDPTHKDAAKYFEEGQSNPDRPGADTWRQGSVPLPRARLADSRLGPTRQSFHRGEAGIVGGSKNSCRLGCSSARRA